MSGHPASPRARRIPRRRRASWLASAWLGAGLLGAGCDGLSSPPPRFDVAVEGVSGDAPPRSRRRRGPRRLARIPAGDAPIVQLHGRRSYVFDAIAVHPWFVAWDPVAGRWETWDVYAMRGPGRERDVSTVTLTSVDGKEFPYEVIDERVGYIDRYAGGPYAPATGVLLGEWTGAEARRILDVLQRPDDYPYVDTYHLWPGPNSNTYAAWVMREAGVSIDLHPMQVGKDYLGLWGFGAWLTSTWSGVQVETPIVGAKVGLLDGIEVHVLALTLGVDTWPPALKTPFGRFGAPE